MEEILESFDEFKNRLNEKDVSQPTAGFQIKLTGAEKLQPKEAKIVMNSATKFFSDLENDLNKKRDEKIEFTHASANVGYAVNENVNETMTINDFSGGFIDFFEFLEGNKKDMDNSTLKVLKKVVPMLNKAWEAEADAHGVDFQEYVIKL